MGITDLAVLAVLIPVIAYAVHHSLKHLKGQGGCCSGSAETLIRKKMKGKPVKVWIAEIQGMHCDHCSARIQNELNMHAMISAKVSLRRKSAVISCYGEIPEEEMREKIEKLGYKVTCIYEKNRKS